MRIGDMSKKLTILPGDIEAAHRDMDAGDQGRKVASQETPVAGRLGFMAGQIVVPDDFDRMGNTRDQED